MARDIVQLRMVGDSLVIPLTRHITNEAGLTEGDALVLETTIDGRIIVSKEAAPATQRVKLKLEILKKRRAALDDELTLALDDYNSRVPIDHHLEIEVANVMGGTVRSFHAKLAQLEVEIAEKRLELFELGGSED